MSTTATMAAQGTADPNVWVYHTRYELCGTPRCGKPGACEDLDEFGKMFLGIRGVVHVHMEPFLLVIQKAPLFQKEEIDPQVRNLLKCYVDSQVQLKDYVDR